MHRVLIVIGLALLAVLVAAVFFVAADVLLVFFGAFCLPSSCADWRIC